MKRLAWPVALALALVAAFVVVRRGGDDPARDRAVELLRSFARAQETHKRAKGVYARDLAVIDSAVMTGVAHGYTFRFAWFQNGAAWALAADPELPGGTHWLARDGQEPRSGSAPFRLEPR